MAIRIRRYIFRLTFCIPLAWFIMTVIFLYFESSIRNSLDISLSEEITNRKQHPEGNIDQDDAVKSMKKKINTELVHVIHKQPEHVLIPINDDDKQRLDLIGLGEMGKPVEINKTNLIPDELKKYEDGYEKHAFNVYVSDLISKHRTLPDARHSDCQKIDYKSLSITATIVMCFHNEAWSALLRSIHSILNRSPIHLLKEIILVDDFSDMEHLKKPLDDYIKLFEKVRIIRLNKREGLIRARLIGAATSQSDVIIFLDSHIETTEGWLEPLLDVISKNLTNVVTPVIDVIDDTTLKYDYRTIDDIFIGGFDWNLQFTWYPIPEREKQRRKQHVEPIRTPTMAGGLFAISKKYFDYLGTYDDGMDIWGSENLELSFRIWMCGGTLVTAPCSHVGHIFRQRSPYTWLPGINVVKQNSIRVAEVWLDEYKKYYYERINYRLVKDGYGDVTSRKLLREKLQCKSFQWYLTEIYPELSIPSNPIVSGEIRNWETNSCLDGSTDRRNYHKSVIGYPCHDEGGNQYFMLSSINEIRRDDGCLDYSGGLEDANKDDTVLVLPCHGNKENQYWIYNENNQLYHQNSNLCMILSEDYKHIRMEKCDLKNNRHKWSWKRKLNNTTNET